MNISTRTRAIVVSLTITLVFLILNSIDFLEIFNIDFQFDFIKLLIISFITFWGTYWTVSFRIKGERFVTVLLFPSMTMFILTLYIELIITSMFGSVGRFFAQFTASIVIAATVYVLILTSNILNIGYLEKIPLTQAGRAAHYVLTLVSTYLFFSIIFSNTLPAIIKLASVLAISYLFSSIALWTIDLKFKQRFLSSIGIAYMMFIFAFVLLIWPISSEYLSLIMSLVYYIALGVALEIREVLSNRIWVEYGLLYTLIVLILFIISNWGINGRLL